MKYAKKMKLVDIDDAGSHQSNNLYQNNQSDDKFLEPRTLSILDASMNEILSRNDMPDSEKWILYNQTLHKFLNCMKNSRSQAMPKPQNVAPKIDHRPPSVNTFNSRISDHSLDGIFPIRDSLDSISTQNVRDFFQHVRENVVNNNIDHSSPVHHATQSDSSISPNQSSHLQVSSVSSQRGNHSPMDMDYQSMHSSTEMTSPQPQQRKNTPNRVKSPLRRGTKRNASQNITGLHPRKVRQQGAMEPRALFRQRNATRSNQALYWESTNAR